MEQKEKIVFGIIMKEADILALEESSLELEKTVIEVDNG